LAGLLALAALPAWSQTAPAQGAGQSAALSSGPGKDLSVDGNGRPDTQVLHPKDGETVSVRLPTEGLLFISSLTPWAVTGGKEAPLLVVKFTPRGIAIQSIGGSGSLPAKVSFTLRMLDGRTITVNVRTGNTKYKVGYAVIV